VFCFVKLLEASKQDILSISMSCTLLSGETGKLASFVLLC
jgi:hypothetical protein